MEAHYKTLHENLVIMKEEIENRKNSLNILQVKEEKNSKKLLKAQETIKAMMIGGKKINKMISYDKFFGDKRSLGFKEEMETSTSNLITFVKSSSSQPMSSSQNQPSKKSITSSISSPKKVQVKMLLQ